ncbi:MAG TPA: coniferyl aldehyde dehydrogenase [Casimicrobiaceae bacterium]|nr:coniferyl aldehyde dehydrogenase [Casimicrobiaceae bacterium]
MNPPLDAEPAFALQDLERVFGLQKGAFARERYPTLKVRRARLSRLLAIVRDHEEAIVQAIDADFGGRSSHETRLGEIMIAANAIRNAMRDLPRWMRTRRVRTPLSLIPGRGATLAQPLGVVGVISPWNYPLQLAIVPVAGALAAGNRVMLKPSEMTPATSALIADAVAKRFAEDELAVMQGDATLGAAFASMRFDHLFFTGSTAVGRQVARAAAENLVPVTLELGGKSPALIANDADLDHAVPRLIAGKLFNAGQTCIAPDYALVPANMREAFIAKCEQAIARFYPTLLDNRDYSAIVNARHYARLEGLLQDARSKGAAVRSVNPANETLPEQRRKLAPALIVDVRDDMAIMREEIFGPLLPIETYTSIDEAIARIDARPRPLAFYYFGNDTKAREHVLRQTIAGGVTVNDTLYHFAHEDLPFGGVGESGHGTYHGERSFLTFSNVKSVFYQSRYSPARLLWPPYGRAFDRLLKVLRRL